MHLKSLVLKGFKSFADRSVLSFEPGITAVVGPNGSGKSNVSDAVLWVLGERNAKNLRGQAMEDVIFAGSAVRKPVSVAEVEFILDNTDGTLPVEYSEVSIARRMYRSGESEYLINGTIARRMDVLDILHDSGLGTGTHSIISQGHLASILQSRPEDRRALIEEAAGVLKHKQRKARSERKLERMDTSLTRVRDIVAEVERTLRPLERKARRALAYKEVSAELAQVKLGLAVDDLRKLQVSWDEARTRDTQLADKLSDMRATIEHAEKQAEALQRRLQVETADAGQATALLRRAEGISDKLDSNVLVLREKKRSLASYLAEMQLSLEASTGRLHEAEQRQQEAREAADAAAQAREAADKALKHAQDEADDVQARKRTLQQKSDEAARARRDALAQLEAARARQAQMLKQLAENEAAEEMLSTQAAQLTERLEAARRTAQAADEAQVDAQAACEAARVSDEAAREAVGKALHERDKARSVVDQARNDRDSAQARFKGLEELERARTQENPLRAWGAQVAAQPSGPMRILEAIRVSDSHMEPLVSQVLADDVWALVARDESEAFNLIDRALAADTTGSISVAYGTQVDTQIQSSSDVPAGAVCLLDYVEADSTVQAALQALSGDVLVCKTLDDARSACRVGWRAVTPDGVMALPTGTIRLFRADAERSSARDALSVHGHLEDARNVADKAEKVLSAAQQRVSVAEDNLRQQQAKNLETSQALAQAKGMAASATEDARRAADDLKTLEREAESLAESRRAARAALDASRPDAAALDDRIRALSITIDEATSTINELRDQLAPVRSQADRAIADLAEAKLASATAKERTDYAARILIAREQDIKQARRTQLSLNEGIQRKGVAARRIDPLLASLEALCAAARSRAARLETASAASQEATAALHEQINAAREDVRKAHDAFDAANERLSDMRVEAGRLEMRVEAAISTIVDECATPLETALSLPELDDRSTAEASAFKLQRKIDGMGTVNPDAAEEYEQLKERFDYLHTQLDDMLTARRSLARIVTIIDERMKDDFADTFARVNDNFRRIFEVLFPGGSGSLELVDPDDMENTGVEVNAQPSGKRILKMSLMSGGEKSLVALALLFAVYKTRSTPFYILDEVEAALDDTNLRRLAAYLDSIRHETQFIMITHQRRTMEMADVLYGISMQADGVTKVMSQRLDKALRYAEG